MILKWKKKGNVFNPISTTKQSWMHEYAQSPSVVIFKEFIRVFVCSRACPDQKGQYVSRLGFVDLKRGNLLEILKICERPVLPLGELGTFDEFGTYPASVMRYGPEIRAYYAGWTRCETVPFNAAIGLAVSRDNGESFKRLGPGPVLSYTPDEPFVLGSPKVKRFNGVWHLWYSSGRKWTPHSPRPEPVYKIRMAHSKDGINWVKWGEDIIESVLEEDECQASPEVFFLKGQYHMLFSYRNHLNFRSSNRGYRIGYAVSDNLRTWRRDDTAAGITMSADGWDSQSVSYPCVFKLDDSIYMFYQGNEIGKTGFGLAQLESSY